MYPRNAASPERIAVGAVVLIADGTVQTSGVTVSVTGQGGSETGSGGTIAYSTGGIVFYTPTQAETNFTSFIVTAYKASCIPVATTVVTTASVTPGKVMIGADTQDLSATLSVNAKNIGGTAQTGRDLGQGIPNAVPGAAGGLLIAGSNAGTTTFGALTVTGAVTTGAISATTLSTSGATTLNSFVVTTTTALTGAVTAPAGITANITGNLVGTVSTLTTYTGNTVQTGDSFARIGAAGASLTGITGVTLSATGSAALTEDYAADNATVTLNQAIYMILSFLFEKNISGTTLTAKKKDGSTTAMTFTLDSATTPTSITRTT